jgi:endonuclease/exonuclease/phosphatase family metal-dependent hydrolase
MWWLILFSFMISEAQVTDIARARMLRPGTLVTVAGRITAGKEFGDLAFMEDRTGGIAIYNASIERGDSVIVTGKVMRFNGMIEIMPELVFRTGIMREVSPKDISVRRASEHEGELVRIRNVLLQPAGHFFYPQRAGPLLSASDTLNYWIDGDTDLPGFAVPSSPVSITGVVGRFQNEVQIIPRTVGDIPGLVPFPNATGPLDLSVMNWNVEFFAAERYGPSDDKLQVSNVLKILLELKPDIVALQEVSNDVKFKELVRQMPGYEGRCSSRYSYSFDSSDDFPPQKLCFIYRTGSIKVVREKIMFRKLFDENRDMAGIFSGGRLPYLLEADVLNSGVADRVYFINYHGKSGAGIDDLLRRGFDAELLRDTLDEYYSGRNVIILGDFNDDVDVSIADGRDGPYGALNDFTCISGSLSSDGWYSTLSYDDVIDHQFISQSMERMWIATQIVNPFLLVERYGETTSDHLPVLSRFRWSVVTGIYEARGVSIYPNPASECLHVTCPGSFEYSMVNSAGVVVRRGVGVGAISLDIPAGLYKVMIGYTDKEKGPISQAFTFIKSD